MNEEIKTERPLAEMRAELQVLDKQLTELGMGHKDGEAYKNDLMNKLQKDEFYSKTQLELEVRNNRSTGFGKLIELYSMYKNGLPMTGEYVTSMISQTNLLKRTSTAEEAEKEFDEVISQVNILESERENFNNFVGFIRTGVVNHLKDNERAARVTTKYSIELTKQWIDKLEKRQADKKKIRELNKGMGKKRK